MVSPAASRENEPPFGDPFEMVAFPNAQVEPLSVSAPSVERAKKLATHGLDRLLGLQHVGWAPNRPLALVELLLNDRQSLT